ncbi:MAG: polysaccharide deacetylase family protein [Anaerolineae bacterium]|nr:polysaccharide deacetylase family protein [Anaerolineae bacterium]
MTKQVPVLITWDVDPSPSTPYAARARSLDVAMGLCQELGIRTTFFVTANAEHADPLALERMQVLGHQIGCHGLTHMDEEEYDGMPEPMQRAYIEQATRRLEDLSGSPIRLFRSPRVKISACTMKLLVGYGYIADSSVCSQRVDVISSNLINTGWLISPRLPYRPSDDNAFKRGNLPIWEVPISAMVIPFISAFLGVFGLALSKRLFRWLYAESKRTGKPIVYLGHPIEFTSRWLEPFTLKQLSPAYIRTHGLIIRKQLYRMDGETWLDATRQLFAYMASFPSVAFMPMGEYVTLELTD